jgi:hypothetical protein
MHAQDIDSIPRKIPKVGLGAKIFGGGYFFPSVFSAYPGPAAGASLSLFAGRFEVEGGFLYFRKYDKTLPPTDGQSSYQSVFHIQDYVSGYVLANIMITRIKRNVFSGYLGVSFRKNIGWTADTTFNNGSHRITENIQTDARRTVGISLIAGVRYKYFFSPRICFVGGLDLGTNVYNEFHVPDVNALPQSNGGYRIPPEPEYQIGFSAGVQFILAGRGFYWE